MLKNLWVSKKRQYVSFPGDRNRGIVSRLFPYSNYKLEMVVTNGRGDGPRSEVKEFPTPEGGMFPSWERFGRFSSAEPRRRWGHALGTVFIAEHLLGTASVSTGQVTSLQLRLERTPGTASST